MGLGSRLKQRYAQIDREKRLEGGASKDDLRRLRRDLDGNLRKQGSSSGGTQVAGRTAKMMAHGFGNIAKSLATPYDKRRPKISQLPPRMHTIGHLTGSGSGAGLDSLKDPNLRGRDLRGGRISLGRSPADRMGRTGFGKINLSILRNPNFGIGKSIKIRRR